MADKTGLAMQQEETTKTPKRSWRKSILCQLRQRNQKEITPFQDLIQVHNRIVERISSLQMENTQLGFINERLKNEIQNLKISSGGYASTSKADPAGTTNLQSVTCDDAVAQSTIAMLEKKLFSIQEELTELHRRKGNKHQILGTSYVWLGGRFSNVTSTILL